MKKLIYLACPFSKPWMEPTKGQAEDLSYLESRYQDANLAAARLKAAGYAVFSPISHGHAIGKEAKACQIDLGRGYATWRVEDEAMIRACDAFYILTLHDWEDSEGIKEEIAFAQGLGKPTYLLMPGHRIETQKYREAA